MNELVNIKHLQEFEAIFKGEKILKLWREFLQTSAQKWDTMPNMTSEEVRLAFHCWKSNAQVFGMDVFAGRCGVLEEKLLKRQSPTALSNLVQVCKDCYQESIQIVERYLNTKEEKNNG